MTKQFLLIRNTMDTISFFILAGVISFSVQSGELYLRGH